MHDQKIVSDICYYKNKLVGLPFQIGFSALYYNNKYFTKYKIPAPKTWEELIKTSKYIIQEEKKLNNIDIFGL